MRFDIIPKDSQHFSKELSQQIFQITEFNIESIKKAETYWISSENYSEKLEEYLISLLRDPQDHDLLCHDIKLEEYNFDYLVQVSYRPGVTDNNAMATKMALEKKFKDLDFEIATGSIYLIKSQLNLDIIEMIATKVLANPLIQKIDIYRKNEVLDFIPSPSFPKVELQKLTPEVINLELSDDELIQLSLDRLWALNLEEMKLIKEYYNSSTVREMRKKNNLPELPVDIEIEILAQTWSEHCKHKIFAADIEYTENDNIEDKIGKKKINGIFKSFIKKATEDVQEKFDKNWLVSVFTDNAGIVRYDDEIDFCLKVETHNSPSALDPYGGALTGILGVNRDILGCGIGAKPIANSNVLCFAPPNYPKDIIDKLPPKLMHPKNILRGVHRGIQDGGNKSGIPTVNGAIHFHDNYAGKPLVYCGTVGVLPQKINGQVTHTKNHRSGDLIVICGGSVGADGIHGATFSSLELDDNAPSTAVQIGDPLTQKRLTDFLLEARDKSLYNSITDNGAGGLSSSVGEMAEHTNGAYIDISKVPLKYSGLSPYEIVISESQERMTFSVEKEKIDDFLKLATKRNVNPAVIGEFTNSGNFEIYDGEKLLSSLSIDFLHNTLPPMKLKAHFNGVKENQPWHKKRINNSLEDLNESIKTVLSHNNIKSKEALIQQYDQEVKASTIGKPFIQKELTGPSNGAVLWTGNYGGSKTGAICLTSGLSPQISHIDTYKMTQFSIDEAVRNAVACGANPDFISLCDNYCWPDPIQSESTPDGEHKLAQLVRSGQALYDTALEYGTPFISGKDSMKNDFSGLDKNGENIKISVPPTLLVTALAKLDHYNDFMTSDFKNAGDLIYYFGPRDFENSYCSTFDENNLKLPKINLSRNFNNYKNLHKVISQGKIKSVHDISEGGLITSIIESSFPNRLGVELRDDLIYNNENLNSFLFNELPGGFIVSIDVNNAKVLENVLGDDFHFIGKVTSLSNLKLKNQIDLTIDELYQVWSQNEY